MKAIDRLSDRHVLALAKFIAGCARVRSSVRWRSNLTECARRNSFVPYSTVADQDHLREVLRRHGHPMVCGLRTSDVLLAANQVAAAWDESPVTLEAAAPQPSAGSG
jgi:hypothetical protein